jgi:hypothetical protein
MPLGVTIKTLSKCPPFQIGSASKSQVTPPRGDPGKVTVAKGEPPAPSNIWNLWLREGYPNRKPLALQVLGVELRANNPYS